MGKGGGGVLKCGVLFSSWIVSCVIFKNRFQENHAMLTERDRRVSLPWLLELVSISLLLDLRL